MALAEVSADDALGMPVFCTKGHFLVAQGSDFALTVSLMDGARALFRDRDVGRVTIENCDGAEPSSSPASSSTSVLEGYNVQYHEHAGSVSASFNMCAPPLVRASPETASRVQAAAAERGIDAWIAECPAYAFAVKLTIYSRDGSCIRQTSRLPITLRQVASVSELDEYHARIKRHIKHNVASVPQCLQSTAMFTTRSVVRLAASELTPPKGEGVNAHGNEEQVPPPLGQWGEKVI